MTISTDGGGTITLREGLRVHTLSIGKERAITDPASLHDRFIAVTTAAGFSNVTAIDS
jgi:hypothetical protein